MRFVNADQHYVSLFQIFDVLSVIVQHSVVKSIDTAEILRVERVLSANFVGRLEPRYDWKRCSTGPKIDRQGRPSSRHFSSRRFDQVVLKQGVQNDSRGFLDLGQDPIELLLRSHQWMHVFYRHTLAYCAAAARATVIRSHRWHPKSDGGGNSPRVRHGIKSAV